METVTRVYHKWRARRRGEKRGQVSSLCITCAPNIGLNVAEIGTARPITTVPSKLSLNDVTYSELQSFIRRIALVADVTSRRSHRSKL